MSIHKIKTAVKSVLDATADALDVITDSPYSRGESEFKAIETLEDITDQLSHLLAFINMDGETE